LFSFAAAWRNKDVYIRSAHYRLSPLRLSVTRVDQSKTLEVGIMQLSPQSSPIL